MQELGEASVAHLTRRDFAMVGLALLVLGGSCAKMQDYSKDASSASAALEQQLGIRCQIGYRAGWFNGQSRLDVNARCDKPPSGEASEVNQKVKDLIRTAFRDPPSSISVTF